MTFLSYYGLSFNPFDKQQVKEKDRFLSNDLQEMINRLDYLKPSDCQRDEHTACSRVKMLM